MPRTAPGLTLLAEGTTIDGRRRSVRSPIVGKTGKEAITLLWAFCSLLMPGGRVAGGQEHGNHGVKGSLGTVEFRVSCTTEAQESFTRGVALLHSFTYEESAGAFREAAAKDSRCAMAHWGLAMTEYHQLWEPYAEPAELQRGSAEIRKARELKPGTPREKEYVDALGVFYDGWEQRDHAARAKAYRDAMESVHERNPKDQEAAIFYALALVATAAPEDKTYGNQREAVAILEPLFAARPDHPGVAHYLIYAYLQLGRNDEAEKIRDHLPTVGNVMSSSLFKINYARAAIRARCALEQQHWTEAENLAPDAEVQPQVAAISHWAAALGAAHTGNLQAARQHTEQVRRLSAELREKGDAYWAEQVAIQGEEAGGWVAFAEHRTYDALRLLRMAADHEDATEKHSVTPGAVRPARELFGVLLMEMHQPKEALIAYRQVLAVAPGRRNALKGAAEAERMAGMSSKRHGIVGVRPSDGSNESGPLTSQVSQAGR